MSGGAARVTPMIMLSSRAYWCVRCVRVEWVHYHANQTHAKAEMEFSSMRFNHW